jgi:integral membrane protein
MMTINDALGRFRIVAFVEGCSYILIGLTMILKYQYGIAKPNFIVGSVHGALFIAYIVLLLHLAYIKKLSFGHLTLAFIASLIPFGTFYADKKLFSKW